MSQKFLRATLRDGSQVISEFSKLARVGRYAADVMAGRRPFNVWRPVADRHPHSGEPVKIRTRQMVNGAEILRMEEVRPTTEDHGYDAARFESIPVLERGRFGTWTCPSPVPANAPEGLVAGAEYPIHRDVAGFGDRYVVVDANAEPEVRYVFESYAHAPVGAENPDADDADGYDDGGAGDDDDVF